MDILEILSEKTTAIALAIVVMYFYNRLVADVLLERKEMLEALRAERKEWLDSASLYLDNLFEMNKAMVEALTTFRSELHNLRGKLTEYILTKERGQKGGTQSD